MSVTHFDLVSATDILKHYYGGGHREYPYCPECVADRAKALKARLIAKYRRVA